MTLPLRLDSGVHITADAVPKPGKELEYGRDLDGQLAQARSWPGGRTAAYFRTDTGFEVSMVFDTPQHYSTWEPPLAWPAPAGQRWRLTAAGRPGRTNPRGESDPGREKEAGMSAAEAGSLATPGTRLVLGTLCLAALILNLDITIVKVELPALVRELGATTGPQREVDAYNLVFAALVLAAGSAWRSQTTANRNG
jgi:hypothetical protein